MSEGPLALIPVDDDEQLARFVLNKRHLPKDGGRVKPEALLPFSRIELSVIRHRDLSEAELLKLGDEVAEKRRQNEDRDFPLLGRVDFLAVVARQQGLEVIPVEGPDLPRNHADVIGWPADKSSQMNLAQEIAAQSQFIALSPT